MFKEKTLNVYFYPKTKLEFISRSCVRFFVLFLTESALCGSGFVHLLALLDWTQEELVALNSDSEVVTDIS